MKERILALPGFLYQIDSKFYYLGKWICKECTETDATDCVMMYEMAREAGEDANTGMYFQKIRGYADFALDIPFNGAKIQEDLDTLLASLSESQTAALEDQLAHVEIDKNQYI